MTAPLGKHDLPLPWLHSRNRCADSYWGSVFSRSQPKREADGASTQVRQVSNVGLAASLCSHSAGLNTRDGCGKRAFRFPFPSQTR